MKKNTQLVEENKLLLEEIEKQKASYSKNLLQLQEENDSLKASVSSLQSRNENVANKVCMSFKIFPSNFVAALSIAFYSFARNHKNLTI